METNKDINQKVEATLASADRIEEVKVSPFLKDKALRQIFSENKEKESQLWTWFTPQLQFAALVLIVAINVYALVQFRSSNYDSDVSNFAESYGLLESDSDTLIY